MYSFKRENVFVFMCILNDSEIHKKKGKILNKLGIVYKNQIFIKIFLYSNFNKNQNIYQNYQNFFY